MFQKIKRVYEALGDAESRELFNIRLEYSITKNMHALQKAVYPLNRYVFADLFEFVAKHSNNSGIIIFGAGASGRYTYQLLKDYGCELQIIAYGDNDLKKQGMIIDGLPVYSTAEIYENHRDAIVIIASTHFGLEIYGLLLRNGILRENLYYPKSNRIIGTTGTQYFDLPFLTKDPEEVYIDGGAFDGKTCLDFVKWYGNDYQRIIAFEPSRYSLNTCLKQLKDHKIERIDIIPKGLYSHDSSLRFTHKGTGSKVTADGADTIEVTSLDKALNGKRATFIKLDIEGCELEALKGAQGTIRKYRPKLAVCIYHKPEDIYEIPNYILDLVPEYTLYIRHYSNIMIETVLYATLN